MAREETDYIPQPNEIYSLAGEYRGAATFTAENGTVLSGDGAVVWSDKSECLISVSLDAASTVKGFCITGSSERFLNFRLQAPDGVFCSPEVHVEKENANIGKGLSVGFNLRTLASEFVPNCRPAAPSYWSVPLLNFVSHFRSSHLDLDEHPLRVFITPKVAPGLEGLDAQIAESRAQSKNSLIIFEWSSSRGFIEALPDYDERVKQLQERTEFSLATAIMVGSVGSRPFGTMDEVEQWFPTELLIPLCVASGAYVGFPFIELRGSDGSLYKRLHVGTYRHRYTPAKPHIHEIFDSRSGATGALVTSFSKLPADKKRYLRVAAEHLTAVSQNRSELENAYDHLVRAFESLTKEFGISSENMLTSVDPAHQSAVMTILQDAHASLTAIAQRVRAGGDHMSADRIDRIAARTRSASQTERAFGLAVSTLCQRYDFPDEAIVNNFYAVHPRADGNNSWAGVLSAYRGGVIHVGYLELPTTSELEDVLRYNDHLHDLLTRIVLIEMGYTGTYQPVVSETFGSKPLHWVTPLTPASALGFA